MKQFSSMRRKWKNQTNGQHTIMLNDATVKTIHVDKLQTPMNLRNWKLRVKDWLPGDRITSTTKRIVNVDLGYLRHWKSIPESTIDSK